ncbi:multicopper oxidase, laccase [Laccaria bicolor S238N-H82]|uniref:Multicopper oxidase, laccase n=1 Tax=Laccaria bicolor (strain S238N-H82 / ATCC MYA-4686) TaxID=486041 RepID=B0DUA4_LACBS|nr:multicopper oxidase, laccase [Laccaria bicolor S238N-H82]XP_001889584.1 multicopper oxidase, laccase [Laccaria bicolor S238N-H82]EDQ99748.1 multicopper oxidase, laccase [Laccaria bicolor S238N-H82]EDR01912.1 multicopper oxidase, laccase [Laccaria bicolor S238N-H82]|eukprot:XP_001887522.1 multicopper oxidase, laccase [Laccaria bicolor S238N-H82]
MLVSTLFTVTLLQTVSASIVWKANIHIVNNYIQPDGFNRSYFLHAVLAGTSSTVGTFPGPLIVGTKGSTFFLNVADHLTDTTMLRSTSIHWHGMFLHGSSWADGPVGVTQCPISPGNSFLYQFSVPDQAGTFWYHSHHVPMQYCDSLRGTLVVYDPYDPYRHLYDFDNESTVITLADWYHLFTVNGATFQPPTVLVLLQILRMFLKYVGIL